MGREPRAVLLLLALAALGHAARSLIGHPDAPPGELLARPTPADADPARHRALAERLSRPLSQGEKVDLNAASSVEISRLPRIGMSLAKRIVEDRNTRGLFRGPGDLDRVPGVGPGLLALLDGKVNYGGSGSEVRPLPGDAKYGRSGAYGPVEGSRSGPQLDLNSASEADLLTLPEIGPARARAILAYRRDQGPFAAVSDLGRVSGLSRRLVGRISHLLVVR
jgi:competence protein ComEA